MPSPARSDRVWSRACSSSGKEDLLHHARRTECRHALSHLSVVKTSCGADRLGELRRISPAYEARHTMLDQASGITAIGHYGREPGGHTFDQHPRETLVSRMGRHEQYPAAAPYSGDVSGRELTTERDPADHV